MHKSRIPRAFDARVARWFVCQRKSPRHVRAAPRRLASVLGRGSVLTSIVQLARQMHHPRAVMSKKRRIRWPWQYEGRHYKLMLATVIVAVILVPVLWLANERAASIVALLSILLIGLQWFLIEPPDVDEKDLHS